MSEHSELMGVLREIHAELKRANDLSRSVLVDISQDGVAAPAPPAPSDGPTLSSEMSTMPPPANVEQPSYYDVSGPGPQLTNVRTVLVVSEPIAAAQDVVAVWMGEMPQATTFTIRGKAERDEWTKKIRSDPQAFDQMARENKAIVFVVGDAEMHPRSWQPAFDVIAVVSKGTNGLVYQLIKGRRARV